MGPGRSQDRGDGKLQFTLRSILGVTVALSVPLTWLAYIGAFQGGVAGAFVAVVVVLPVTFGCVGFLVGRWRGAVVGLIIGVVISLILIRFLWPWAREQCFGPLEQLES